MARITDTPLFKSVAPRIKSISKQELAKQLAIVKKSGIKIEWDAYSLIRAFYWAASPQGHAFWEKLFEETE